MNRLLLQKRLSRVLLVVCFLFVYSLDAQEPGNPQFIRAEIRGLLRSCFDDRCSEGRGYFVEVVNASFSDQKMRVWLWISEQKVLARRLESILGKTVIVRGNLEQMPAKAGASIPPKAIFISAFEIDLAPPLYPAIWFAPVNDPNKPSWEVLPQEAKPGEVILSKRNELGLLSNFAATPFILHGKRYASVEGFWQMMLYPEASDDPRAKDKRVTWEHTREQVAQMTAFEAKQAGTLAEENMKTLGIDWVSYRGKRFAYRSAKPGEHCRLIVAAMRAKAEQNSEVK